MNVIASNIVGGVNEQNSIVNKCQMIGQPSGRSLPVMFDIVSDLEDVHWNMTLET